MLRNLAARLRRDRRLWVEAFVLFNLAGLVFDIYIAHSINRFHHPAEYVPLYFAAAATTAMAAAIIWESQRPAWWRYIGHIVGWLAILIGLAGVVLHLESQFFYARTVRSLTYAAPFAAPLAFTGLGLLLIANRMVEPRSDEWARWVLLLALGGFVGNFVFSLTDHAQNGFFNRFEWIPVVSSALAIGFLSVPFLVRIDRVFLRWSVIMLIGQVVVGLAGFAWHMTAILHETAPGVFAKLLSGPPPMAPLLFPNLSLLALIAVSSLALDARLGFAATGTPLVPRMRE
jgi:hypothetical protein